MGLLDFGNVEKLLSRFDRLEFYPGQCSKERDRLSSCQECVRVCPRWAVSFAPALQVDLSVCDGCGLCATVCPNGVFEVKEDPDNAILNRVGKMASEGNPTVSFVCRRISLAPGSRAMTPPEAGEEALAEAEAEAVVEAGPEAEVGTGVAAAEAAVSADAEGQNSTLEEEPWQPELRPGSFVVPSLGRLNEAVLVGAVAQGATLVWLDEGPCEECGSEQCREVTRRSVDLSKRLLELFGSRGRIVLSPEFPEAEQAIVREEAKRAADRAADVSRRQFLSAFRLGAMAAGAVFIEGAVTQITGEEERAPFTYHVPTKRKLLLKLLRKLGKPEAAGVPLGDLPFAEMAVGPECNMCGNCARFCPTSALREHKETVTAPTSVDAGAGGESAGATSAPVAPFPASGAPVVVSGAETAAVSALDFSVPNCTRCALCLEICPFDALSFKETLNPQLLLTDKPARLIALEARKCVECGMEFSSSSPEAKRCVYCEMRRGKLGDDSWS